MVRLVPFRALRYDPDVAGPARETSAPPYDELDRFDYSRRRTSNPYTVLELLAGHDRAPLDRWQRTGVLRQDDDPVLYLYEQQELRDAQPATVRGLVGTVPLSAIEDGSLLLHEEVDTERARRRAERLSLVPVELTPVMAVHVGGATDVRRLMDAVAAATPDVALVDEEGIEHRLWRVSDPDTIAEVVEAYDPVAAVLADGHHRIAAAAAAGSSLATVWLVDTELEAIELRPIHRLVRAWHVTSGAPAVDGFAVMPWSGSSSGLARAVAAEASLCFGVVTPRGAWLLRTEDTAAVQASLPSSVPEPLRRIDVVVLSLLVLPAWGAMRVDPEPDVERGVAEVTGGLASALVLLRPPTPQQVREVAGAGLRMPAKTTWFRPKPRTGLVMRILDEAPTRYGAGP